MVNLTYDFMHLQIQAWSYAKIPFPLPREELEDAAEKFVKFLEEKDRKEKFLAFKVIPDNRTTYVGYRLRRREYDNSDEKELFHYNEYFDDHFEEMAENSDQVTKDFLKAARKVYYNAKAIFSIIMLEFEKQFPGVYRKFFPQGKKPHFYLRFLKYDVVGRGSQIARPHYDRGHCTIAIAESAPGLRLGRAESELQEVKHRENSALFFPGYAMHELTSKDFLPAWHDVIQKEEDTYSDKIARWSIVFFADEFNTRDFTFEEVHTLMD